MVMEFEKKKKINCERSIKENEKPEILEEATSVFQNN